MQKADFRCFCISVGQPTVRYSEFVFSRAFTEVAFVCCRKGVSAGSVSQSNSCPSVCLPSPLAYFEYIDTQSRIAVAQNFALRRG